MKTLENLRAELMEARAVYAEMRRAVEEAYKEKKFITRRLQNKCNDCRDKALLAEGVLRYLEASVKGEEADRGIDKEDEKDKEATA